MQTWQRKTNPLLSTSLSVHLFGYKNSMFKFYPSSYGYGSIPIDTMFSGLFTSILTQLWLGVHQGYQGFDSPYPSSSPVLRNFPQFSAVLRGSPHRFWRLILMLCTSSPLKESGIFCKSNGLGTMGWDDGWKPRLMYQICIKYVLNMCSNATLLYHTHNGLYKSIYV